MVKSSRADAPVLVAKVATLMAAHDHRNSWDSWYDTARWQRLRARQLLDHPLCAICASKGFVAPATIVDHVLPHRGDWNKFILGTLQSLCKNCHDGEKKTIESRGYSTAIGLDGYPTDPGHPAYQGKPKPMMRQGLTTRRGLAPKLR